MAEAQPAKLVISVQIPVETVEAIDRLAAETGEGRSVILRAIIRRGLKTMEMEGPDESGD